MHRLVRVIFLPAALLVALGWSAFQYEVRSASLPRGLNDPPPLTPILEDIRGAEIGVLSNDTARECYPITLREAGAWLPLATVAIEDHRFWSHAGVDFHATSGAALRNLRNARIISGASTITQQLVKLASGRTTRALEPKIHEAFAALKLEQTWSKERILEVYLNRLDYGNRRFGPEAAARAYFGKSARDLTLAESIFLAGLPQSPSRLNPWTHPERALARYNRNVRRLGAEGLLPKDADQQMLLAHAPQVLRCDPPAEAPYFAELVHVAHPMARVRTTLDLDLQKIVARTLREHLASLGGNGVGDAAIVVLDNTSGEVRALACAGDPRNAAINAAMTPRSAGSSLKPFLYVSAIEQRALTAATLLPDTPDAITTEYRDYDPQNYSQRYLGPVRVREALGNSLNVPAVVALSRIGARETFDGLAKWGLHFPGPFDAYGAGFILGNAPVRLVELAGAYASLERGGRAWEPRFLSHDPTEGRTVISSEAAMIITDILCDNDARTLSFGPSSPLHLPWRTAVKTGTSSGFRDGWCMGFSRDHTVGVWAGNLDGRPMGEILAVHSAAPLWATVMRHLYAQGDREVREPVESDTLHAVEVAAETGFLPRPGERTVREWFLPGTEPQENAATHYANGVLQLPPEYAGWCASSQNRFGAKVRSDKLAIVFPRSGAVFALDANLPKSQQMIPLQSSWPGCEWFLNGHKLAQPSIPLERGDWSITARAAGEEAVSRYSVE